jgi:hypothetical protein
MMNDHFAQIHFGGGDGTAGDAGDGEGVIAADREGVVVGDVLLGWKRRLLDQLRANPPNIVLATPIINPTTIPSQWRFQNEGASARFLKIMVE